MELNNARTQIEFLNRQVGISMVSRIDSPKTVYGCESLIILFSCRHHLILGGLTIITIAVYQKSVLFTVFQVVMV